MYTIRVEMPSGATSRGYERETEAEALAAFARVRKQLAEMTGMQCEVVLMSEGVELQKETVNAA